MKRHGAMMAFCGLLPLLLVVLNTSLMLGCANLPGEDQQTGIPIDTVVNTNQLVTTPPSSYRIQTATASRGIAYRWRNDPTKCLARPSVSPSAGQPLMMTTCASDDRQAFVYAAGLSMSGNTFGIGLRPGAGGQLSMESDPNLLLVIKINGGSMGGFDRPAYQFQGVLSPQDTSGADGNVVLAPDSAVGLSSTFWDVTGVGAQARGTTLALNGCDALCVTKQGTSVVLSACDVSNAAQRWSLSSGALLCDAGQYLTVDVTQATPVLQMTDTAGNSSSNNQGWLGSILNFWYGTPARAGAGALVYLVGDGNTRTVTARETNDGGSWFLYGGTASKL